MKCYVCRRDKPAWEFYYGKTPRKSGTCRSCHERRRLNVFYTRARRDQKIREEVKKSL